MNIRPVRYFRRVGHCLRTLSSLLTVRPSCLNLTRRILRHESLQRFPEDQMRAVGCQHLWQII